MSSEFGNKIKLSIFGESHGEAIGCVIDSIPAGVKLDMEKIYFDMARRAPGKDKTATPRLEKDIPHILSGVLNGVTTGAPLAMIIENTNTKSGDYSNLLSVPRPSHSDYPAYVKYQGNNDIRGGGHFSGRLTAPLVFAGAIAKQMKYDPQQLKRYLRLCRRERRQRHIQLHRRRCRRQALLFQQTLSFYPQSHR
jgi:chorismate synthase